MTILDIELIESLDFEFAPPCENPHPECDKTAEWFVLFFCGCTFLLCTKDKDQVFSNMELARRHNSNVFCNNCDKVHDPEGAVLAVDKL